MASISNLPTLVRATFKAAQESGALTFYQTQLSILHCNGLPFQVRFSPSLANKPKSNKPRDPNAKPFDPFEDPPKNLFITQLPSHNLVLNKFPVIPDHFILATKEYKEQTHILDEEDLGATYACLKSYSDNGEELFGFFNSGEHSGASQPHRHLQFLPVESMRSGMTEDGNWQVLADLLLASPGLPFVYFSSVIPDNPNPRQLHDIYISLYDKACQAAKGSPTETPATGRESSISYNMGITDRAIVLCPRNSEGIKIRSIGGELIGPVSLNGTVLGGTLLVKTEEEWKALRKDELKLMEVLGSIGIKSTTSGSDGKL